MKTCVIALFTLITVSALNAQSLAAPDTLIAEYFETDPTPLMALIPSGDDQIWVNYDADGVSSLCLEGPAPAPSGWLWDADLGSLDPQQSDNNAFTSCSYLTDPDVRNSNWLITKPVSIPDTSYHLYWRSLSFYGPGFLDGYKVLVSKTSNDPAMNVFTDTLFVAAEMIQNSVPPGSLNVEDYVFSPGYIHANGFTDADYFFVDNSQGPPFLHGKFEPHEVSLAAYAGQTIYIAFLHDSQDDFILQIDDILVSKSEMSPATTLENVLYFNVLPNPVRDNVYFSWKTLTAENGQLVVQDQAGKIVARQSFSSRQEGLIFFETSQWAQGVYICTLETTTGRATTKLIKF